MEGYSRSFENHKEVKKLFYLIGPEKTKKRNTILDQWSKIICHDAHEVISTCLVPLNVLKDSGHLSEVKDQIFKVEGQDLGLRPEIGQSIFSNLKKIRHQVKGNILKIWSFGHSFRNEKSTRGGKLRRNEFEQLELYVVAKSEFDFFKEYLKRIKDFFEKIHLNLDELDIKEIEGQQKPHYSNRTLDFFYKGVEIGCMNDRGQHDLFSFSQRERESLKLYEISLGLDRIFELTTV